MADSIMRLTWMLALIFAGLWIAFAVLPRVSSEEALSYFDEAFLARSRERASRAYVSAGLSTLTAFLAVWYLSRSPILSMRFQGSPTLWGAARMGAFLGLAVGGVLLLSRFPFAAYSDFYVEGRYGLSRMTFSAWLTEYGKSGMLSLIVYCAAGGAAAWLLVRFPGTWHYWLGGLVFLASLFVAAIYPSVIAPIFDAFHPLSDPEVLGDVQDLARQAGMKVDTVLVMEASRKTTRANAYFAGLGKTKQVVLYDTLLQGHSREEIRLVLAHELAHWRSGHVFRGIAASFAGTMLVLGLFQAIWGRPGSSWTYASLERCLMTLLLFAMLASYVLSPVSAWLSRRFETQSDAYSLQLTGDHGAFVSSQVNLARANLGDVEPPWFIRWFAWTHPTTLERIRTHRFYGKS